MMALLVQQEVIPYFEYQSIPTYRGLLKDRPVRELVRRSIYLGGEVVGEAQTVIYPGTNDGRNIYTEFDMSLSGILKMLKMDARLLGATDRISLISRQRLNASYRLDGFDINGRVLVPVHAQGERQEDVMKVSYELAMVKGKAEIPFEKTSMMTSEFSPMLGVGKPSVGKRWKLQTLQMDILSGRPSFMTIYARIEDRELIDYKGKKVPAYRVEFRKEIGKELPLSRLWVDEEGEVLVEEQKIFALSCRIVLEERTALTPEQVTQRTDKR
jgi:hypothetical protein